MAWIERYIRADADGSGNGTTDTVGTSNGAWTLTQYAAFTGSPLLSVRANMRAGTYIVGSASRSFAAACTIAQPTWLKGFKNTPGDMDGNFQAVPGTDIPLITFSSGQIQVPGSWYIFENLSITSASTFAQGGFYSSGVGLKIVNCTIENTGAGATSYAFYCNGSFVTLCSSRITKTDTTCAAMYTQSGVKMIGGVISGGANAVLGTNVGSMFDGTIFMGSAGDGVSATSASMQCMDCLFYSIGGSGIRNTSGSPNHIVKGCHFELCTTACVRYTGGTSVLLDAYGNTEYGCGSVLSGITESQSWYGFSSLTGSGLINAAGGRFTPSSYARGKGFPKDWPGLPLTTDSPASGASKAPLGSGGRRPHSVVFGV